MLGRFEMSMHRTITRRDFLNGTLLASGAALVSTACPLELMPAQDWTALPVSVITRTRMATHIR